MQLWKRCRILANSGRLEMIACLDKHPRLHVKALADRLGVAEDVASKNLQLLAQAGFLDQERKGKYLYYWLVQDDRLLRSVMNEFGPKTEIEDIIFQLTGFTHERRLAIVSVLSQGMQAFDALCRRTRISPMAMRRQLEKLERRRYVVCEGHEYRLAEPASDLGRALMDITRSDFTLAQV